MAPGGGICKEVIESSIEFSDYEMATPSVELRGSPCRKATTGFSGNLGTTSNNDVHELLECPICLNLMYPPIYQVFSFCVSKHKTRRTVEVFLVFKHLLLPFFFVKIDK